MYKNQLQELAQRSCFNLPSYSCVREGPDHAPRFKATVNFNGETFESPSFCSTLRQAEHAAAEVALKTLAIQGPTNALASKVLDETGVYKNLLQETAQKAGLKLPFYSVARTGRAHISVFSCTVEIAGMSFKGEPARTKKQAEKNAAIAAWSALKKMSQDIQLEASPSSSSTSSLPESKTDDEQDQVCIARFLASKVSKRRHVTPNRSQQCLQSSTPVCMSLTIPASNLHPHQYQSWSYANTLPGLAVYHLWQQEILLQQRNHMCALPFPAAPPTGHHHVFPSVQSAFQPEQHPYLLARNQEFDFVWPRAKATTASPGPSFYSTNNNASDPYLSRNKVTIQEIREERTKEFSESSSSVVLDPPPSFSQSDSEIKVEVSSLEGSKQKIDELENRMGNVDLLGNQSEQYQWDSTGGSKNSGMGHVELQSSACSSKSPHMLRPQYLPTSGSHGNSTRASHIMLQTVPPPSSVHLRPQNLTSRMPAPPVTCVPASSCRFMHDGVPFGGLHPSCMAPAVRIRSILPVHSALPERRVPSRSQATVLQNLEQRDKIADETVNSEGSPASKEN